MQCGLDIGIFKSFPGAFKMQHNFRNTAVAITSAIIKSEGSCFLKLIMVLESKVNHLLDPTAAGRGSACNSSKVYPVLKLRLWENTWQILSQRKMLSDSSTEPPQFYLNLKQLIPGMSLDILIGKNRNNNPSLWKLFWRVNNIHEAIYEYIKQFVL